ncbi:ribose-phosphate pyrophosphokinase [Candidatus Peregrinibacteria bacterium HGW-Peregrinibacteria-1]|nr:MAG: ribose-phosphate pyrophosphokinase [Candidatus Peregrinibacteria bacterium HGW-Peregrinibacteria-1]
MIDRPIKIVAGSSHYGLAKEIADNLGVELTGVHISRFSCNEIYVKLLESVRGADVFVVQTSTRNVNEDLMELFIILDALKRSFAGQIHVVMPHYAYSRQDRVSQPREPISAKLIADLISTAGADHVITMKLHSDQAQGFFNFPVDNLDTEKIFAGYFKEKNLEDLVVVSPDAGGAKDAKHFADLLGARLAIIHKNRPEHNSSEVSHVVGKVEGRTCLIYDDMVDTGGSVVAAKEALLRKGAKDDVYLMATHPVFSGPAVERLRDAGFKEVVVTNSVPVPEEKHFPGLKVLSIAPFLSKIIRSVHEGGSVTDLHKLLTK